MIAGKSEGNAWEHQPAVAVWETVRPGPGLREATWKGLAAERELDTHEARALVDTMAGAGCERIVLECLQGVPRPDLAGLVRHAASLGSGAIVDCGKRADLDPAGLEELADAGVRAIAVALDGIDDVSHAVYPAIVRAGIALEIVTSVGEDNLADLQRLARWVESVGAARWRVEFPFSGESWLPTTEQADRAAATLIGVESRGGFVLEVVHLPHLARIRAESDPRASASRAPEPADGRGTLFVSWCGDIYPSRDLPLPCGNVRLQDVLAVYRFHPMFRMLRDPDSLEDRCGRCEYRRVCGGSRARAFGVKHQVLASDPLCSYQPRIPRTSFP